MFELSGKELLKLKDLVVENFNESNWKELGALTNTLDEVENHPRLIKSLSWNDSDYEGLALIFLRKMIGPNNENLRGIQDYVEGKFGKMGENVSSAKTEGRKIVFSPNIFEIPSEPVSPNLISVMMPLKLEFSEVFETIKDAATQVGFSCIKANDIWDDSTVIQDIFSLIFRSYIVVCDFTGKNPNVFYEAGIANTLGKHVVPITQVDSDVPFDLQHHRYAKYLNNKEGLGQLKEELVTRFSTLAERR